MPCTLALIDSHTIDSIRGIESSDIYKFTEFVMAMNIYHPIALVNLITDVLPRTLPALPPRRIHALPCR